nr:MAG TPA: hypothetical protein [Caudoviricetes sp.]
MVIMNKKDVLGGSACCLERPKNEKCTPTLSSAGNAQNTTLNRARNGGKFWRYLVSENRSNKS